MPFPLFRDVVEVAALATLASALPFLTAEASVAARPLMGVSRRLTLPAEAVVIASVAVPPMVGTTVGAIP